jgi:tartrate-resistant acid phosphatase type 5
VKRLFSVILVFFLLLCCLVSCKRDDLPDYPVASLALNAAGDGVLGFFILTDWGFNGIEDQLSVRDEMVKIARKTLPEFVVSCGDNFHYHGVTSVQDPRWLANFENIYTDESLMIPWYVALGNHDYWFSDPDVQVMYSSVSSRWNMPSQYFSFTKLIGDNTSVKFIVLETEGLMIDYRALADKTDFNSIAQYTWFEEQLKTSTDEWVIVVGHHPVFSASPFHKGEYDETMILIEPLLEKYQPDFYFCGHDHVFEHARNGSFKTDHFVSGAGINPAITGFNSRTIFTYAGLGFIYMTLDADNASLHYISSDDRIIYSYTKAN